MIIPNDNFAKKLVAQIPRVVQISENLQYVIKKINFMLQIDILKKFLS